MSKGSETIHEYRHSDGVNSISVRAGSEADLAFAGEPDWALVPAAPKKSTGKSPKDSTGEGAPAAA